MTQTSTHGPKRRTENKRKARAENVLKKRLYPWKDVTVMPPEFTSNGCSRRQILSCILSLWRSDV